MAARLGGDADDIITDINITPFVDIVLVVLIIFMVTATYIVKQAIKVTLPEAATGETVENTSLGLMLDAQGGLFLDGERIDREGLRGRIRQARAEGSEVVALIAADEATPHGKVVGLLDLVRQEGVVKFAINIEPVSPPSAAPASP